MADLSLNNIPLDWVRAFEAAGRTGSFTAAARECNVTQASISQRISNLEQRIGARLFLRSARGVKLSVQGESWLPYVSAAFRSLNESYEDLFGVQREKVAIFASASVNALWLSPRLWRWRAGRNAQVMLSTAVLAADGDDIDAAARVQYGPEEADGLYRAPLFAERLSPVAAPDLLRGSDDWRDLPRLAVAGPRPGWHDWARHTGDPITPVPQLRFDSFAAALSAAEAGAGVLLASLPLCAAQLDQRRVVRLSDDMLTPRATYWLVARPERLGKSQWRNLVAAFCED